MAELKHSVVHYDFEGMLAHAAGGKPKDWKEIDGPDSGCGLDYWYKCKDGREAYINLDQTTITISVDDERVLTFDMDEAPDDDPVRKFINDPDHIKDPLPPRQPGL